VAFATRCPSANQESEEHSTTKHEHHDEDEHRDEDGERTRSTMPLCYAEQKHGCSLANPVPLRGKPATEGRFGVIGQ
jgi:hypothetical protein